eukprot:gene11161-biopygen12616
MVTLADSGATGCLMAQDMAERLGLHIRPWEHGTEGFTCANEGIIGINGTATLPFSIQQFKGSAHVHVVDKLPGGLDLILGSDWMRDEKAILDYDDMRLILKKHGCSLIPVNRTRDSSVHSFFTMALSGDSSVDPVISGRKAAKILKAGANHIMVNIRDSRPVDYPASNVSATETADLLAKAVPSSVHLPNPPEVEVDFETWVKENCPEHGDPALMPAHVVRYLLRKFKKVFNALPMQTPKHRDIPHVIKTEENAYAPYRRNRRMSHAETARCEEYVAGLLKHGFITPSSSPYGAPIMIIAKPGGVGYRVVCDWRALNNITIKNRYPLPRIDETIDRLSGATIFSSLDLTSGYCQIRISDEDAPKAAFTTPMGQYEFKVLGMGLANAPATFQAVMNKIFAPYLHKFVVVYLDDILVYGRNPEEHAANLEKVLQVLQDEEFYAKLSKCTFKQSEIKFLGHIIGRNGVKVNPKKVATVRDWPTPRHAKHVQQFLGDHDLSLHLMVYSLSVTECKPRVRSKKPITGSPLPTKSIMDRILEGYASDPLFAAGHKRLRDKFSRDGFWFKKSKHGHDYLCVPDNRVLKQDIIREQHDPIYMGHCDLITALPPTTSGHDAIAVFVDKLSKMVHVAPCSTTVSAVGFAAIYLDTVVRHHGIPKKLLSDRDARFTGHFGSDLQRLMETHQALSTAFHPQTDGQTERMNRVIEDMICHHVGPYHDDWDQSLALVEFAINNSWQESIQNTPFRAYLGYDPRTPMAAEVDSKCPAAKSWWASHIDRQNHCRDCLKAAQSRQKANYDTRRREVTFSIGEQVLLSTRNMKFKATGKPKFVPRWVGPYTISGVIGPRDEVTREVRQVTACRLDLPKMMKLHPVFHVGLLKSWHSDGQPVEFDTDGSPTWTAACIMRQKSRVIKNSSKRREEYLIRWTGYGIEQDTWESAKEIDKKSPQIVTAWLQRSQKDRDYRTGSRSKRKNPSD